MAVPYDDCHHTDGPYMIVGRDWRLEAKQILLEPIAATMSRYPCCSEGFTRLEIEPSFDADMVACSGAIPARAFADSAPPL